MSTFNKVILFTDTDGFARFREETVELTEGKPQARLSPLMASGGQLKHIEAGLKRGLGFFGFVRGGRGWQKPHFI